ncbi:hypothetical protein QJS04_geneDACA004494 [Acorus gramineus]|uniref:Uncharacterized protein n=1 Tax=Acorus gramineus TaxID=55184 RepID=A0AAV9B358_ACOGR|nr:hypothetical protein QJS04_geneDACA004494 [Acorus gramineus]
MIPGIVKDSQVEDNQVQNINENSLQDSDSIALGVCGFNEASREYEGHDLLSEDDKSEIESFLTSPITHEVVLRIQCGTEVLGIHIHDMLFEGRMTEGYVIDAYFDLLKVRIQDNPEVHWACLFGKHFAQVLGKHFMLFMRKREVNHGKGSFSVELPKCSENGDIVDKTIQNKSVSVHPMPSVECSQEKQLNILEPNPGSSTVSASSSPGEEPTQQSFGREIKRRKRHRRKNAENQEPAMRESSNCAHLKYNNILKDRTGRNTKEGLWWGNVRGLSGPPLPPTI